MLLYVALLVEGVFLMVQSFTSLIPVLQLNNWVLYALSSGVRSFGGILGLVFVAYAIFGFIVGKTNLMDAKGKENKFFNWDVKFIIVGAVFCILSVF